MNSLIKEAYYFSQYHPIRFWGLLVMFVGLIALSIWYFIYRNSSQKKKKRKKAKTFLALGVGLVAILILLFLGSTYFFKTAKPSVDLCYNCEDEVLKVPLDCVLGIDVSHYQGAINWPHLNLSKHPVKFVIVRATMGFNGEDRQFDNNWVKTKEHNYIRGAYHYYRPNENSTLQFNNFKNKVELSKGDLPPVLDVEKSSFFGNDNLIEGVRNWLLLAEKHYGVKPILYTGKSFYENYIKGEIEGYPLWIAAYSGRHRVKNISWTMHQFTEKARFKGIRGFVDANSFKGGQEDLIDFCIK